MPIIHNNIRSMADYKYLSFEPVPAGIKAPVFNGDITPPSAGSPLRAEPVAFLLESFLERLKIGGFKSYGTVHPDLYTFSWKLKSLRSSGYTLAFNPLGRDVSRWGTYTQIDDSNIGNYGYWSDIDKVALFSNVVSLCFTDETERMNDTINNALWPENWHLTKDVISHIPLNEIYYAYSLAKSNIAYTNKYPTCDNKIGWSDTYEDSIFNGSPSYGFFGTIYGDRTTTPLGQCSFETSFAGTLKADVSLCALTLWSVDDSNYVIIPTSSITIPAGVTTATFPETWLSLAQRAKSVCPPTDIYLYNYVCCAAYPVVTVTHTIFPEAV